MNNLVTVLTRTYASELAVIQSMLQAEGIETFLKDELAVQSNPLYSNAIGGVKLQVREIDVPRTAEILKEAGLLEEEKPSALRQSFGNFTAQIPLLNRLVLEARLIILGTIVIMMVMGGYYLITMPSVYESLTEKKWCVDHIVFKQQKYTPSSWGFHLNIPGRNYCNERLELNSNGRVILPGFNTNHIYGTWSWVNDKVIVTYTDTFRQLYEGEYDVNITFNKMVLKSPGTSIYCYQLFE